MINSRSDLNVASENIPTYISLDPEMRRGEQLREIEIKSQPIDIFVGKLSELRKSLLGNVPADGVLVASGKKIVDWFMSQPGNDFTRQELTQRIHFFFVSPHKYPQSLYPVKKGEEFKDGNNEYRFLQDQYSHWENNPSIANFSLIHHTQLIKNLNPGYFFDNPKLIDKTNVLRLLEPFTRCMKSIIETFGSPDGKSFDYQALSSSRELYDEFLPAVRSLAYIPFEPLLEDPKDLKSTFINIYNMMQIHLILDHYNKVKKNGNHQFRETGDAT